MKAFPPTLPEGASRSDSAIAGALAPTVRRRELAGVLASLALAGCATTTAPDKPPASQGQVAATPSDPWENWNRKVFSFNDKVDAAFIKPVAITYVKLVPQTVRTGVNNFYGNVADAWSAVNNLLQGKFGNGAQDIMRVTTNTVLGMGGLIDWASEAGIERHNEDFGQTLGRWGIGAGPYIVWPLLGPSSVRDSAAMPLDRAVTPALAFSAEAVKYTLTGLGLVNERANLLPSSRMLDDMALDKYSFVREAYLQRRRSLVYDGNEPQPKEEAEASPPPTPSSATPPPVPTVPPPAAAASQSVK